MIRVRQGGEERELSYGDFIREVQEGRVTSDTPVLSDVLTSGVWKPAGELQFFRSWAPRGTVPLRPQPGYPPGDEQERSGATGPEASGPGQPGLEVPASGEQRSGQPKLDRPERERWGERREAGGQPPEPQAGAGSGQPPWIPYGDRGAERPPEESLPPSGSPPRSDRPPSGPPFPSSLPPRSSAGWEQPPAQEVPPGPPLPWEEMERHGFIGGLVATIRLAFRDPDEFFRGVARGRGLMPALVFGLLLTSFSIAIQSIYDLVSIRLLAGTLQSMQSELPEFLRGDLQGNIRQTILMRGIYILFYPVFVFLASGLIHLMLRVFGRPRGDFATTFRVINYASVVDILMILPVCGSLIVWVWELVMMVRGLSRLHGMGAISVVAAILVPLALLICLWMQAMVFSGIMHGVSNLPGLGGAS